MSTFAELASELEGLLRLKISPVGIKLFPKRSDIPMEFEVISATCAVCQIIGKARYHETGVATTRDAVTACGLGGAVLGFYDAAPDVADGTRNEGAWAKSVAASKKLAQDRMMIEKGRFEAFGAAPLKKMTVEPDIVQVWGTPVQMLQLVYAHIWDGGDNVQLSTNGHGASCYEALVVPYVTGKVRLAIADIGDRRFAYAADNEMIVGFPVADLERLTVNLRESYAGAYKYPYAYYMFPIWEGALERCKA
ncbi:MAG: DUF169 domain-containing protein [Deltaproteobacteria bacterium]|nr:DUF169 domain-containing protein [Deltaproteobacteria bacterium]